MKKILFVATLIALLFVDFMCAPIVVESNCNEDKIISLTALVFGNIFISVFSWAFNK